MSVVTTNDDRSAVSADRGRQVLGWALTIAAVWTAVGYGALVIADTTDESAQRIASELRNPSLAPVIERASEDSLQRFGTVGLVVAAIAAVSGLWVLRRRSSSGRARDRGTWWRAALLSVPIAVALSAVVGVVDLAYETAIG